MITRRSWFGGCDHYRSYVVHNVRISLHCIWPDNGGGVFNYRRDAQMRRLKVDSHCAHVDFDRLSLCYMDEILHKKHKACKGENFKNAGVPEQEIGHAEMRESRRYQQHRTQHS